MKARYDGTCAKCEGQIHVGDDIDWDRDRREACHRECGSQREAPYDPAYDANPEERWERIKRINLAVLERQEKARQLELPKHG